MKKVFAIFMTCMLLFSLTACGSTGNTDSESTSAPSAEQTTAPAEKGSEGNETASSEENSGQDTIAPGDNGKSALVVYFSATGNTKAVAETFAAVQGADLYEIVPEQPYTDEDLNYNDSSTRATVEQNDENARPAISGSVENIEDYDVIYVGFPNWWASIPMPIASFLEEYDFSGKTIVPFCSHGGGRFGQSLTAIAKLTPDATMGEGLSIHYSGGSTLGDDVAAWLETNGITVN